MEMFLMGMSSGIDALLGKSAPEIQEIGMMLNLCLAGIAQPLFVGMVLRPSQKFSCSSMASFQHIAGNAVLMRTKGGLHGRPRFNAFILYQPLQN